MIPVSREGRHGFWGPKLLIPLCGLLITGPLQGQQADSVTVRGRLVDSVLGRPIPGQLVGTLGNQRGFWANTDSTGAFQIRIPAADTLQLLVTCLPSRRPWGRTLGPFPYSLADGEVTEIRIPAEACWEPPETEVIGEWSGHYTGGFEESGFVPCHPLPDLSDTAYGLLAPSVWMDFEEGALNVEWPEAEGGGTNSRYFMTVHGTRRGPGGYGHLGFSVHRILVDSILVVRLPTPNDCGSR